MIFLLFNQTIREGNRVATKRKKRSELREESRKEFEKETEKKEIMSKNDKYKWLLFSISLLCLWILAHFSA